MGARFELRGLKPVPHSREDRMGMWFELMSLKPAWAAEVKTPAALSPPGPRDGEH